MRSGLVVVALVLASCAHPPPPPPPPSAAVSPEELKRFEEDEEELQAMMRLQLSEPPEPGLPPWGMPTIGGGPGVKAVLEAVGAGGAQPSELAAPLVIGPALWAILLKLDPALAEVGTPSTNPLPHRTGPKQTMEVRSFMYQPEHAALLRSPGFRKIGRAFGQADLRAATRAEREIFYLLVPLDVRYSAIYVAQRDAERLVVLVDERHRPAWIDVLSAYDKGAP